MIRELTNGERLVAEGLRIELRDRETRIATSAEIARWANVSESTVSRAMPGLIAKRVITARRVMYAETGRDRWEITLVPIWADAPAGAVADPADRVLTHEGSVMDAGLLPPQEESAASERDRVPDTDTSMTDPSNLLDSESFMQQQHAAHDENECSFVDRSDEADATESDESDAPVTLPDAGIPQTLSPGPVDTVACDAQPTYLPGGLSQMAFSGALAKIQRVSPGYTELRFAADLDKALTRFGPDEADRAVALAIWCAMRGEPVYGRDDLRARARMARPLTGTSSNEAGRGRPVQPAPPRREHAPRQQARQEDAPRGSGDDQLPGVVLPAYLRRSYEKRLQERSQDRATGRQDVQGGQL